MPSKAIKKDYTVSIQSEKKISPHVLDLKEMKIREMARKIPERSKDGYIFEEDKNLFFDRPRTHKIKLWYRIRAKFYSIFPSYYLEHPTLVPHKGGLHPSWNELAIINLVKLVIFSFWYFLKLSYGFMAGLFGAFFALFARKEASAAAEEICEPEINLEINERAIARNFGWRGAIAIFVIVSFALVLPLRLFLTFDGILRIKEKLMTISEAALGHVSLAFENPANPDQDELYKVQENLTSADNQIGEINIVLQKIISAVPEKGEQFADGKNLIRAGSDLSQSALVLNQAFSDFKNTDSISLKLLYIKSGLQNSLPKLKSAKEYLDQVKGDSLPENIRNGIAEARSMLGNVIKSADEFAGMSDVFLNTLGSESPKKYLLIFQNNTEIRPTGGFIGSFAEIKVDEGEIKDIYFPGGGSYDLDGSLIEKVAPPAPLQLVSSRWFFRDANWFPDFPATAKKIMWFYEKSGQGSVDGVIAFNASLMEDLLKIFGPVQMASYGKTLDADNFMNEVQLAVEKEYDKEENKPKQILADMMPILLEKMATGARDDIFNLLNIAEKSLGEKKIQFYFTDESIEKEVLRLGWGGKMLETSGDYLSVINTNIAGQKTDAVISEKIEHLTKADENGNLIDTITVTREHRGVKGDLFYGARNVDYVRVYAPRGSILISAGGFTIPDQQLFDTVEEGCGLDKDLAEIEKAVMIEPKSGTRVTEEFGKTVFGNWIMTDPGKTTVYTITYKLPFGLDFNYPSKIEKLIKKDSAPVASYNLFVQKQSGSENTEFSHLIDLPGNMAEIWRYYNQEETSLMSNPTKMKNDKFFGNVIGLK